MIVDGSPFPWPTAGTPQVRQLLPDFFEVTATFYARSVDGVAVTQLPAALPNAPTLEQWNSYFTD